MADQEGNIFSFDELVNIFSYLSPGELSKCSQVCKDWYEASQVGSLWKKHCLQKWNFCHLGKLKPGSCVRNNYFQNGNFLPVFYSLPSLHYSDAQRLCYSLFALLMFQYSKGERKGTLFSGGKMSLFSIKTICQSLSIDTVEFHLLTNHLFLYLCNNE